MLPITREKLQRNLAYFDQTASYYQKQVDDAEQHQQPDRFPGGEAAFKHNHARNQYLAKLNADVAKQLRDVLTAEPIVSAMQQARDSRPTLRNAGADLKPMAGRFTTPRSRVFH